MSDDEYYDLKIRPIPTSKHNLKQRQLMEKGIIPQVNSITMIIGSSGSGKTCLLCNLLQKPYFYGRDKKTGEPFFDETIIFSKTGGTAMDDSYSSIDYLTEDNFIHDLDPAIIDGIIESQEKHIKQNGYGKRKILIILDDVLSAPKFLKSPQFLKCAVELRHLCCSVIINTQSYTKIPRAVRLQCTSMFFFPASMNEVDTFCEANTPPNKNKKEFIKIIQYATNEPYNFLYVNKKLPLKERYRKNLDEIIQI